MTEPKLSEKFAALVEHLRNRNADEAKRLAVADPKLLEYEDDSGRLALHWAASAGCLPFVQFAIGADANLVTKTEDSNWTPLMIACSAGRADVVKYLLSFPQTDVNHRNSNGQSSLHYACSKNHLEIAKLLIENGAEVNAQDKFGATPLHRAASQAERDKLVQLLLSTPSIRVNLTDREGNTALHCACEDGNESVALALIRGGGADAALLNKDEKTPIALASGADFRRKLQAAVEATTK